MSRDNDLRRPRGRRRPARLTGLAGAVLAAALGVVAVPAVAAADSGTATVRGELVHVWAEGAQGHRPEGEDDATRLSWVATAEGAVRVPAEQVADVPAGATVELTVGSAIEDEASADGHDRARTVLESDVLSPPPGTTAEVLPTPRGGLTNEVTVVLVAPAGTQPDSTRLRDVVTTVDGTVSRFWSEQTGGAVSVGVTGRHEWVRTAAGCADPQALWDEVAARVGFVAGPGRHLMLRLSGESARQPACSYALATVGTSPASGGRLYVRDGSSSVVAHELGHNFGLGHSSGQQCDGAVEGGSCRTAGYRDYYDVMGASWAQLGSLNAVQAAALGILPGDALRTVSVGEGATSVTLAPLGGGTGLRALRLVDADGVTYWLEFRTATGRDAWLGTRDNVYRLDAGVLLRRTGAFPDTSLLLDGTPGPAGRWDADLQFALPAGVAIPLSGGDFTVAVRSVDAGGAVLDVVPAARPAPATASVAQSQPGQAATLLPGAPGRSVAAPAGDAGAAAVVAPEAPVPSSSPAVGSPVARPSVSLEPVGDTSRSSGDVLMPVAGSVLGGSVLLLVQVLRRHRLRG